VAAGPVVAAQAVVAGPAVAARAVAGAVWWAVAVAVARAVVAGPAVAALQVYPGRAAAPEEVAPFWVAPVPPVCSFRTAERLAHLSAASFQAMSALTACPKEAAPQASEVAHPVL
jgi:hypothetical protein